MTTYPDYLKTLGLSVFLKDVFQLSRTKVLSEIQQAVCHKSTQSGLLEVPFLLDHLQRSKVSSSVSSLSQTLPGSVHLLADIGQFGTILSLFSYEAISPYLQGLPFLKPGLHSSFKNGDCEDLNGHIPLAPTCMLKEKQSNFYFSKAFSHFTTPLPAPAPAQGFSRLPPVHLPSSPWLTEVPRSITKSPRLIHLSSYMFKGLQQPQSCQAQDT